MDSARHLWIVCYDIADARRLRRIARTMEGFGLRAQKSVFECWLDDAGLARLHAEAAKHLAPEADSIRCYRVCHTCREASEGPGHTPIKRIQPYYIC